MNGDVSTFAVHACAFKVMNTKPSKFQGLVVEKEEVASKQLVHNNIQAVNQWVPTSMKWTAVHS